MRKQDRVAAAKQEQGRQEGESQARPEPRDREQLRGAKSTDQPTRPQRQGGKLPLPD